VFLSFLLCLFSSFSSCSFLQLQSIDPFLFVSYLSILLSLSCSFCWFIHLVIFLFSPFYLLFVAFYERSSHLTTSRSVIILNGKKHAHKNLLRCLLIMTSGSSLGVYRRFRSTWLCREQHFLKRQYNSATLHIFKSWYTLMAEEAGVLWCVCSHEVDCSCYDNIPCSSVGKHLFRTLLMLADCGRSKAC